MTYTARETPNSWFGSGMLRGGDMGGWADGFRDDRSLLSYLEVDAHTQTQGERDRESLSVSE